MSDDACAAMVVLILAIGMFFGGCWCGRDYTKDEGIRSGHATYKMVNPTNGTTRFEWLPSCVKTN